MLATAVVCAWTDLCHAATTDVFGGTYSNWPTAWMVLGSLNDPIDAGTQGNHGVELMISNDIGAYWSQVRMQDADGNSGLRIAPKDFHLTGGDAYLRTIDLVPTINFGQTILIDWAINLNYVTSQLPGFVIGNWKFQFGSIKDANDHNFIDTDIADGFSPTSTLTSSWSAPVGIPEPGTAALAALLAGMLLNRRRAV